MTAAVSRRALLVGAAAAPLLSSCPVAAAAFNARPASWKRVVAEYYRLRDAAVAEQDRGSFHQAMRRHEQDMTAIAGDGSRGYRRPADPEDARLYDAALKRVRGAENAFHDNFAEPRWAGAAAVYQTPAPSLAALVDKIEVVESEDDMDEPDAIRAIIADVRRLAQAVPA